MNMSFLGAWRILVRIAYSAPTRFRISAVAFAFTVFTLVVLQIWFNNSLGFKVSRLPVEDISQATQNTTLGFAKAFYISLPYRTDRQDAMELLAATSNLRLTYQAGVIGSAMNEKAKVSDGGLVRDEQWGSWRGHADVWRRVVNEKLETALILEDDVDWDVNIHDVFEEFSRQMRKCKLQQATMTEEQQLTAPYGLDWDILYVGTCWDIPRDPRPKHIIYHDPNAPGRANLTQGFVTELEDWGVRVENDTHKRVLAPSWYPVCTIGYAVTQRGAQRLLYNVGGVKRIGSPLDLAMNDQVKKGYLKAYTVIPPLITTWKVGGMQDSDIDDIKKKEKELEDGEAFELGSRNLWSSARERMNHILGNVYVNL